MEWDGGGDGMGEGEREGDLPNMPSLNSSAALRTIRSLISSPFSPAPPPATLPRCLTVRFYRNTHAGGAE